MCIHWRALGPYHTVLPTWWHTGWRMVVHITWRASACCWAVVVCAPALHILSCLQGADSDRLHYKWWPWQILFGTCLDACEAKRAVYLTPCGFYPTMHVVALAGIGCMKASTPSGCFKQSFSDTTCIIQAKGPCSWFTQCPRCIHTNIIYDICMQLPWPCHHDQA